MCSIVLCVLNVCKPQEYPGLLRSYANTKIDLIKKIKIQIGPNLVSFHRVIIKKKIFKDFQFFNGS